MHILRPHLNSDVSQVACPLFFYTPLILLVALIPGMKKGGLLMIVSLCFRGRLVHETVYGFCLVSVMAIQARSSRVLLLSFYC